MSRPVKGQHLSPGTLQSRLISANRDTYLGINPGFDAPAPRACPYPIDEHGGTCNKPPLPKKSYCAEHAPRIYAPAMPLQKK